MIWQKPKLHREEYRNTMRRLNTAKVIIAEKDCFSLKNLALNGNDIKEMGYKGKEIGEALDLLLNGVIEGKCVNSPEELRLYLDSIMKE